MKDLRYGMNGEGCFLSLCHRKERFDRVECPDASWSKNSEETRKYVESQVHGVGGLVKELKLPREKDVPEKR